ncbi:threonine synthase [bacterium LRH843]|nr:threonine synthase [bacterium LRH843]
MNPLYNCLHCGSPLEVSYDYEKAKKQYIKTQSKKYDWFHLLPVEKKTFVHLGEGNTPLLKANRLAKRIGVENLFLKCEFSNPTGSFKDRPVSIGINKALQFGYRKVVVASSGNGAGSVAAYCARAGLEAIVLVPESTPLEKVKQARGYGANVIKVSGPYSHCFHLAKELSEKHNFFNVTTTFINPYTVEGDKLIAFEMLEQMEGTVPDAIYVPIGAGPLLVGILKGYTEYGYLSGESSMPRMAGIQAEGCSPIAQAFLVDEQNVQSEKNPQTIAGGICDGLVGYEQDGTYTLNKIRQSQGFSIYVSDHEIKEAGEWLAQDEGLFVEPAAAAGLAGLVKSLAENRVKIDDRIVVLLTGHGLKDMSEWNLTETVPLITNQTKELLKLLKIKE